MFGRGPGFSEIPKFRLSAFPVRSVVWCRFVGSKNLEFVRGALLEGNYQRNTGVTDGRCAFGGHRLLSGGFFALSGPEVVPTGRALSTISWKSLWEREPAVGLEPTTC